MQAQTDGLLLGYNAASEGKLTMEELYVLNADGEVPELMTIYAESVNEAGRRFRFSRKSGNSFVSSLFRKYHTRSVKQVWLEKLAHEHCSAMLKLVKDEEGDIQDLLVGHTTWDDYSEMVRIFKSYSFEFFNNETLHAVNQTFSSYAGTLSSTDDFYLINSHLVVLETTIEILNENIYNSVLKEEKQIPDYMRIVISNRLAKNAP